MVVPDFIKIPPEKFLNVCPHPGGLGYRHMCRFQSKLVFEQPILQGVEWYWRLDDDSELHREVGYDVFRHMESEGYLYGYIHITRDAPQCVVGLWENTAKFIQDNDIQTFWTEEWLSPYMFYNNFEICRVDFWRNSMGKKYLDFIDKIGGHYTQRWGDAPVHSLAVTMFIPQEKVHQFSDIAYRHQEYVQGYSNINFSIVCSIVIVWIVMALGLIIYFLRYFKKVSIFLGLRRG